MYAPLNSFLGAQPFGNWFAPDTTQRHPIGSVVPAVDPFWGYAEFVYGKAGGTIAAFQMAQFGITISGSSTVHAMIVHPNTANTGRPVFIAMNSMTSGQFGWFARVATLTPIAATNSIAADTAFAIVAAGNAGTLANGKQIVNAHNQLPSSQTVVKANTLTQNGSATLVTAMGYDGWFLGMALSGTGIPASTVVAKLDPDGRTVYTGSAIGTVGDKNATASGSVSVTGTATGYILATVANPFVQGQIV